MKRILGSVKGPDEGPTVVGIGGLHGNEPAGVVALETVLQELGRAELGLLRGRFVALAGNCPALEVGVRFLDQDLNRIWIEGADGTDRECEERRDLSQILDDLLRDSTGPIYAIDLHTTSGDAPPFAVLSDAPANREFGLTLPVPLVLGLAAQIEGTLLEYLDRRHWVTVGFESGTHTGIRSTEMAASALWILLASAGLLDSGDPRVGRSRIDLGRAGIGLPRTVRVFHRYPVTEGKPFRMVPGFRSFQLVRDGELLARDGEAEVRALSHGRLLMPRYQPAGSDGFFLVRTEQIQSSVESSLGLSAR